MPVATRAAIWLACASPLIWIPGGFDRFIFPKLVFSAAAIGCGALAERQGKLPRPVALIVTAGLGWFVLACLLSPTPVASFFGRWPRYEGVPVLLTYIGSAWLGARLLGSRTPRRVDALFSGLAVASVALLGFSLLSELGWSIEGEGTATRSGSVLGNATEQGLVAMLLTAVLFAAAADRRTPLIVAGALAAPVTVVLSGSRAAFAATVVTLVVQLLVQLRVQLRGQTRGQSRGQRTSLRVPVAASVAGLALLALAVPQLRDRLTNGQTVTGRLQLWEHGLRVGLDRWWSGGPSTFVDASGQYRDEAWVREVGVANPPDSAHNWMLQALDSGGVVLLGLAVALAVLVLLRGWQVVRDAGDPLTLGAFAATIGYGLALLPNFTVAGSTCLAAFLVGGLVAERAGAGERLPLRRGVAVLAAAGVLLFGAGAFAERSLLTGITAAAAGDLGQAEESFDTAALLRPYDGDVAMFAAQAYAGATSAGVPGAAANAERWALQSLERTSQTYASGLALAVARIARNDLAGARAGLDRLLVDFPTEPAARIQLGIVKFGQRDVDGARAELLLAQRLDPRNPVPARILTEIEARVQASGN